MLNPRSWLVCEDYSNIQTSASAQFCLIWAPVTDAASSPYKECCQLMQWHNIPDYGCWYCRNMEQHTVSFISNHCNKKMRSDPGHTGDQCFTPKCHLLLLCAPLSHCEQEGSPGSRVVRSVTCHDIIITFRCSTIHHHKLDLKYGISLLYFAIL